MSLIIENGSGVFGANSYIAAAAVTTYLTNRSRSTENSWSTATTAIQESACIAATDYIEDRFRLQFLGVKQFSDISNARAVLTFTAQPLDTETVTLGTVTYTFNTILGGAGSVLIGDLLPDSIDNLLDAINSATDNEGETYGTDTDENDDASAEGFYDDTLVALSLLTGTAGNSVATTTTVTGAEWNFTTLNGGSDRLKPQPLSFPRSGLLDRDGLRVIGMPSRLLDATAEYAVRARAATLAPDPTIDDLGGIVTSLREKVGPLETETQYLPGTVGSGAMPAYPAADRLLSEFLRTSGVAIR